MSTPQENSLSNSDSDAAERDIQSAVLRERAEMAHRHMRADSSLPQDMTQDQMRAMLHDLQVHKIELEMQNEELRRTQLELDASRSMYFDLYDLAPVGYCTLSESGLITQANLMAASLLGIDRCELVRQPISHFVLAEDQDAYYSLRHRLIQTGQAQHCELRLRQKSNRVIWIQVTATLANTGVKSNQLIRIVLVDITHNKQAEIELTKSQEFSLSVLNSLQDHIAVLDENGVIVAVNNAWVNFSNRNNPTSVLRDDVGENYFSLCAKAAEETQSNEGAREFYSGMQRVLSGALDHFHLDYPCHSPTARAWYRASVIRMNGYHKGLIVSHTDITDSKQLELALQDRSRELLLIADNIPGPVSRVDRNLRYLFVNKHYQKFFGRSSEQILGLTIPEVVNSELWQQAKPYVLKALDGQQVTFESQFQNASGETTYLLVNYIPDFDEQNQVNGFFVIALDIGNRRRAEIAQAEAHDRLVKIASRLPGVVYQFRMRPDGSTSFPYASERMQDVFHVAPNSVRNDASVVFEVCHPDDRASIADSIRKSAKEQSPWNMEFRLRFEDGTECILQGNSLPEREPDGSTLWHGFIMDVTEPRKAEAQQASLEAQLRESQKMEAIGTLAGGIAHDFNNMLAIILNNVDLAQAEMTNGNGREREFVEEIRKASERARGLVQQILSFSRKQLAERVATSLHPTIDESARLLRATLPARLTLTTQCAADTPPVMADGTQIEQVIINLVTNAMQAMRDETGKIEIRLERASIDGALLNAHPQLSELLQRSPEGIVRLGVIDDGPGMDAPTLNHIFEPFFTTKPVGEGTGLGLSVVHGIVQSHDGVITVDSQPGKGTTFFVYLPATTCRLAAQPEDLTLPSTQSVDSGSPRILYLDDDTAVLKSISLLLKMLGFAVMEFQNQAEALDAIRSDPYQFDLVITDYHMPGMSGLAIANEIQLIRSDLPIAITSGFIDDELRTKAAAMGVRELIAKPIVWQHFTETIRGLLK